MYDHTLSPKGNPEAFFGQCHANSTASSNADFMIFAT